MKLTRFANGSPLRKIAKEVGHAECRQQVKRKFRVPTDSTWCKVKVAFQGQTVGQKTFKC